MKKQTALFFAFVCFTLISCRHHANTSISLRESDHYFSMKAYFSENRTRDVEEYMDDKIGERSNMSFVNTRIDGQLSLDDRTQFYMKKSPGHVEIKLDKNENSNKSYQRIKSMCEGIKEVIAKP